MDVKGLTALITGGASGLGAATAKRLIAQGANVIIADRDDERGAPLADELGSGACFAKTDVTSEGDVQAAIDVALNTFGGLQVLVNCAGVGMAMRSWHPKHGSHPLDLFRGTRHRPVAPLLRRRADGV